MGVARVNTHEKDVFERIFHPERIAIVGVSSNGAGFGGWMMGSLLEMGYAGTIYPVNPRGGMVRDMKIYPRIEDIPEDIDFVIIAVPAEQVPETLDAALRKGAAGAEILSAGFRETGTDGGMALEKAVVERAKQGIRVIGPNCFGVYCPGSGLTLMPGPDLSRESGPVAFLSQSGGMSIDFAHMGRWMGVRFSKVISFGNGADLRETELLRYLGGDPETGVVAMYVEGVQEGRLFFDVLREVGEKKPVVIYKGGLSDAGNRAVLSHTASLGGSGVIWKSLMRQCNVVPVADLMEMAETTLALSRLPGRVYRGITVAGGGGALGVGACDAAESFGLELPRLEQALSDRILSVLPKPGSSALNPIDVGNPYVDPGTLKKALLMAAEDDRVDIQVLIQLLYHFEHFAKDIEGVSVKDVVPIQALADAMKDVVEETGKPVVLVLPNNVRDVSKMEVEEMIRAVRDAFLERNIPVFDDLTGALRAIGHVSRYYETKQRRR